MILPTKLIAVASCVPHERNYNAHSAAQIEDLRESLRQFGQVKPIAVKPLGKQNQIVAGEGLWTAAKAEGWKQLNAVIIPAKWSKAKTLAYLAADNELARRGSPDQAQLDAIVREVLDAEGDVLARLAAGEQAALDRLRAADEGRIVDDPSGEWQGMPGFEQDDLSGFKHIIVHFDSPLDMNKFSKLVGQKITEDTRSIWYPKKARADLLSVVAHEQS